MNNLCIISRAQKVQLLWDEQFIFNKKNKKQIKADNLINHVFQSVVWKDLTVAEEEEEEDHLDQ